MAVDLETELGGQVEEVKSGAFHAWFEVLGNCWREADEGDTADVVDAKERVARATQGVAEAAGEAGVPAQGDVGQHSGAFEGDGEVVEVVIARGEQVGDLLDEDDIAQPARAEHVGLEEVVAGIGDGDGADIAEERRGDEVGDVLQVQQAVVEDQAALAEVEGRFGEDEAVDEENGRASRVDERRLDVRDFLVGVFIELGRGLTVVAIDDGLCGRDIDAEFVDDGSELSREVEEREDGADELLPHACDDCSVAV